jgi:hypothetical protein
MIEVMFSTLWYIRTSVTDSLNLDHLPITFSVLDSVRTREVFDPVEKQTDWNRFQSLASELISKYP